MEDYLAERKQMVKIKITYRKMPKWIVQYRRVAFWDHYYYLASISVIQQAVH